MYFPLIKFKAQQLPVLNHLKQGCQTRGLLGPHCIHEQLCRGPHEVFDLEITTSPGNDLCSVARSEVDLQKKRSSSLQHLHTVALIRANRVLLLRKVKLSPDKKICTTQVPPVIRSSNVCSKMIRCNTAEIH